MSAHIELNALRARIEDALVHVHKCQPGNVIDLITDILANVIAENAEVGSIDEIVTDTARALARRVARHRNQNEQQSAFPWAADGGTAH
jgi:hypothetical protein